MPQPGYIGVGYQRTKLLLVGQNPAVPPAILQQKDREYTASLRALRAVPTSKNYDELRVILSGFIPNWPVHGQYFPLEECRLSLDEIAYFNLVRCRTQGNAPPHAAVATNCQSMFFGSWLEMLSPRGVVFIGSWASKWGGGRLFGQWYPPHR